MVKLDIVRAANSALPKTQPLVAVFIGGTSGICEYTFRSLVTAHANVGKGLRAYIVGRNAGAAESSISDCQKICPTGQFRFVQAEDLALLKDVDRVCLKIIEAENSEVGNGGKPRIDLLVMSQACAIFGPRKDTKEGLDVLMSLMYYSRMRFIVNLLPLLLASSLPAHVISIYAAGTEGKLLPDDLSVRNPTHYTYLQARSHITYMTTLFMESLAERHREKLSLCHVFPGLVITPGFQNPDLPTWFKHLWRWIGPIVAWFTALSPTEAGERMLFLATPRFAARQSREGDVDSKSGTDTATEANADIATGTDGKCGSGAYAVNWNGETISVERAYRRIDKKDLTRKVWDHTTKAFEEIEVGHVFAG